MTRTSRASHSLLGPLLLSLGLVPFILSGCLWYLNPSEPVPELLLHESFDSDSMWGRWSVDMAAGYEFSARQDSGRLEVFGPGHLLRSQDEYPTNLTILVEWSAINGDAVSQLYPAPIIEQPDFQVKIDDLGLSVQLFLYGSASGAAGLDTLRIADQLGAFRVATTSAASSGVTRGTLKVQIAVADREIYISASAPELGLEASTSASIAGKTDSSITIGVSGLVADPRALEEVYLFQEPSGIGGGL